MDKSRDHEIWPGRCARERHYRKHSIEFDHRERRTRRLEQRARGVCGAYRRRIVGEARLGCRVAIDWRATFSGRRIRAALAYACVPVQHHRVASALSEARRIGEHIDVISRFRFQQALDVAQRRRDSYEVLRERAVHGGERFRIRARRNQRVESIRAAVVCENVIGRNRIRQARGRGTFKYVRVCDYHTAHSRVACESEIELGRDAVRRSSDWHASTG